VTDNDRAGVFNQDELGISVGDCDNNGQQEMARLVPKQLYFHYRLMIGVAHACTDTLS